MQGKLPISSLLSLIEVGHRNLWHRYFAWIQIMFGHKMLSKLPLFGLDKKRKYSRQTWGWLHKIGVLWKQGLIFYSYCWWTKSDDHQLRLLVYPFISGVLHIPGGCLGFHPSTVPWDRFFGVFLPYRFTLGVSQPQMEIKQGNHVLSNGGDCTKKHPELIELIGLPQCFRCGWKTMF